MEGAGKADFASLCRQRICCLEVKEDKGSIEFASAVAATSRKAAYDFPEVGSKAADPLGIQAAGEEGRHGEQGPKGTVKEDVTSFRRRAQVAEVHGGPDAGGGGAGSTSAGTASAGTASASATPAATPTSAGGGSDAATAKQLTALLARQAAFEARVETAVARLERTLLTVADTMKKNAAVVGPTLSGPPGPGSAGAHGGRPVNGRVGSGPPGQGKLGPASGQSALPNGPFGLSNLSGPSAVLGPKSSDVSVVSRFTSPNVTPISSRANSRGRGNSKGASSGTNLAGLPEALEIGLGASVAAPLPAVAEGSGDIAGGDPGSPTSSTAGPALPPPPDSPTGQVALPVPGLDGVDGGADGSAPSDIQALVGLAATTLPAGASDQAAKPGAASSALFNGKPVGPSPTSSSKSGSSMRL